MGLHLAVNRWDDFVTEALTGVSLAAWFIASVVSVGGAVYCIYQAVRALS